MAAIEQKKADENVMKLAEDQKVCGAHLLALLTTKNVLVSTRMTYYKAIYILYRGKKSNSMLKSFSFRNNLIWNKNWSWRFSN